MGAALENIELAARAVGLDARADEVGTDADALLVARVSLGPGAIHEDPLFPWLTRRVTNRRRGARRALSTAEREALFTAARARGGELHLLEDAEELVEIGALIAAGDRLSFVDRAMHRETFTGFRWTRAEVESHRDGLDVATLELDAAERAVLELLADWPTMELLGQIGGGSALGDVSRQAIEAAAAVGLVCHGDGYLRGGRAVQRTWLTATSLGLAIQPLTALPYLFARVEDGAGAGLSRAQLDELAVLRTRYRALFPAAAGTETLLFRIADAEAPSARSLRRRLDDVLVVVS